MRFAFIFILFGAISFIANGDTLEVPAGYPSIQAAIDAAVHGDMVLVSPGTYYENIKYKGKAITLISREGPEITVIDGMQTDSTVTLANMEGTDSVLDGFTITNGRATQYYPNGGGVACRNSAGTLLNNIITKNSTYSLEMGTGGGVGGKKTVMINNLITRNTANKGGGAGGKKIVMLNNRITGNLSNQGGGIYISASAIRTRIVVNPVTKKLASQ